MKKIIFLIFLNIISLTFVQAATVFYTNQAQWQSLLGNIYSFTTTATNIAKADEVPGPPASDTGISKILTWQAGNTGFPFSFRLTALQSTLPTESGIVFNDPYTAFNNALSIGNVDAYEDDDWKIEFIGGTPIHAFAFNLRDNDSNADSYSVYNSTGGLLATISGSNIPTCPGTSAFLGVISDVAIGYVMYDDDSGGDDIAIADFQFGVIPEPNTYLLGVLGITMCIIFTKKK